MKTNVKRIKAMPSRAKPFAIGGRNPNPMSVTQQELTEANNFKKLLKRELRQMGIKRKFNVVISQNHADFPKDVSQTYSAGKWLLGQGMHFAKYKSKRRQRENKIKHVVGVWRSQREDGFYSSNIRFHEIAHAAVAELLKKHGWVICRDTYPEEVCPFIEGLTISFHLERFAGNPSRTKRLLRWYTSNYRNSTGFDSHGSGLQLAKLILSAAPHAGAERRLLREAIAEAGFKHDANIWRVIRDLEDKQKARKILAGLKKAA